MASAQKGLRRKETETILSVGAEKLQKGEEKGKPMEETTRLNIV